MFPLHPSSLRAAAVALLLAAGVAGAKSVTFAPADAGKPVVLEGRLDVLVEDYPDGHSRQRHFLETSQGRVELTFARKPTQQLSSGARVRVHGQAQGDALALDGSAASVEVLTTTLPNTMGEQSIAVLLVNFQDETSQPKTLAEVRDLVFGNVSNHYLESSFGQTWFKGQTFGWYTVAMSKTECDPEKLQSLADAQAALAGVDLANFQRRVYISPTNACPWQGLGVLGGVNTRAWVNGLVTLQVVGHELGHNYGLSHAHAYNCDTGVFGDYCSSLDYGDAADLMGNGRTGQFSSFAKEFLGWLNDGVSPPITTVTTSGRYSIEPYSASSVGPKALKVPLATDAYGRKTWYYLEYRQPIGADSVLGTTGNLTKGVMVRYAVQGDSESMHQLDMSPSSSTKNYDEMADGALAVGQSYFEESIGRTITLVSTSPTEAVIDVQFGPSCTRAKPTVSVIGGGAAVDAGTTVAYTVSVTNRDSSGCAGATTFSLWRQAPEGWASTLDTTPMTLLPGQSASAPLTVTSTATAGPGNYNVFASVTSPLGNRHASNGGVIYTVLDPTLICRRATPTISLVGGNVPVFAGSTVGYALNLTNNDSSACAATNFALARSVPAGWTGTLGKTSATLAPGATTSTTLNVTSSTTTAPGSYGLGAAVASAVGAMHTAHASAFYTAAPTLSVADAKFAEGNAGTTMANFTVSLAQPTVTPVTFDIATKSGSALAGTDFAATSRTGVTIPAGSTSATVSVPIVGDTAIEGNETFQVLVTNVVGAPLRDGVAIGTIGNDDTALLIGDVSVVEGQAGTRAATFTVKLSTASVSPVTFNIATANRTAIAGSDYAAFNLAAQTMPAGSTTKTFNVIIFGDAAVETHETFLVNVSGVKGAVVADAQAVGTIRNDDAVLTIADASIAEGNSGTKTLAFTVKLSAPSANPVTFNLATANKTAAAGLDYVALALTGQSFPAGTTSKVFNVTIKADTVREGHETFVLNVGGVVGAAVGDAQAIGTITNDD